MLNKVILMGRLTRDPELRHTQSNTPVASFTLAIDRGRKDANGQSQADFIDCVAWNKSAEFVQQWFSKGMMMIAVGRIQSRRYQDKNGNNRTAVEVVVDEMKFGETKKSRDANGNQQYSNNTQQNISYSAPGADGFQELPDDDGDVPF